MTDGPPKFSARQQSIQTLTAITSAGLGAVCGSFISDAGTFYGAVLGTAAFGSLVSGTAQWGWAHLFHHAGRAGRHLPAVNTRRVRVGAVVAATGFAGCLATVTAFEAASGQTLHAATSGHSERAGTTTLGTTFGRAPVPSTVDQPTVQGHPSPSASITVPPSAVMVPVSPPSTTPAPSKSPSVFLEPHPTSPGTVPPSVFTPSGAASPAPAQPAPTTGDTP